MSLSTTKVLPYTILWGGQCIAEKGSCVPALRRTLHTRTRYTLLEGTRHDSVAVPPFAAFRACASLPMRMVPRQTTEYHSVENGMAAVFMKAIRNCVAVSKVAVGAFLLVRFGSIRKENPLTIIPMKTCMFPVIWK